MISGFTRVLPLIGHPVAQVKTPAAFNAHFARATIDAVIFPLDLAPEGTTAFFDNLRHWHNCDGCSVTVPHKQAAFAQVDRHTQRALMAGAVNIIRREADGSLYGDMTDGAAMVAALESHGFEAPGSHSLVVGAGGGAGAAIVLALCEAGVGRITLLENDGARLAFLTERLSERFPGVTVETALGATEGIDLILNASPLGMSADDTLPIDPANFSDAAFAADAVTEPEQTNFLRRAAAQGMSCVSGLEMIARQLPLQMAHLGLPNRNLS